jgi:hypothetical protein
MKLEMRFEMAFLKPFQSAFLISNKKVDSDRCIGQNFRYTYFNTASTASIGDSNTCSQCPLMQMRKTLLLAVGRNRFEKEDLRLSCCILCPALCHANKRLGRQRG